MNAQRALTVLICSILVGTLLLGCDGEKKEETEPDVEEDVVVDMAPTTAEVTVNISGNLTETIQTHESGGVEFTVETRAVYLVVGNVSILSDGEAVPAYTPDSDPPLEAGKNAIEGYAAVELIEGGQLGTIEVPAERVGPVYMGIFEGERVGVINGGETLPLDNAILYIDGQISVGETFVKDVNFTMPGGRVLVAGAPAFDADSDRIINLSVDLDGWFDGVDIDAITHTNNVVTINPDENTAAYDVISTKANAALEAASIEIQ